MRDAVLDGLAWALCALVSLSILFTCFSDVFVRSFFVFFLSADVFLPPILLLRDVFGVQTARNPVAFLAVCHGALSAVMLAAYVDDNFWLVDQSIAAFASVFIVNTALCALLTAIFFASHRSSMTKWLTDKNVS